MDKTPKSQPLVSDALEHRVLCVCLCTSDDHGSRGIFRGGHRSGPLDDTPHEKMEKETPAIAWTEKGSASGFSEIEH